jgi:hypothetical protein
MAVRLSVVRTGSPLPPGRFLVLISVTGWVDPRDIVRLEGLGKLKNPVTSSGIWTATIRLVAQFLNQLLYRVPPNLRLILMLQIFYVDVVIYSRYCSCIYLEGLRKTTKSFSQSSCCSDRDSNRSAPMREYRESFCKPSRSSYWHQSLVVYCPHTAAAGCFVYRKDGVNQDNRLLAGFGSSHLLTSSILLWFCGCT